MHEESTPVKPAIKAESMYMSDNSTPSAPLPHSRSTMSTTPQFQFDNRQEDVTTKGVEGFVDVKIPVKAEPHNIE